MSSAAERSTMDVHVAAGKIQSVFRGITARRRFANFMRSLRTLDAQAVIRCLQIVEEWHDGWSHLLYSLLVLVFLLVLVYFQFVEGAPGNTDFNNQIIAFALSADAQYSAVNVPLDLLAYVGGLLATVQSLAPAPTPAAQDASCTSMFDTYCSGAYLINDSRVPQCVTLNAGTGFIDAQNQILYAIFLTQTRRRTASCSVFEPYALPNGTSYRACVQDAEDDVYASDWCDANPGMCNTTAMQGFAYVEQIPGYALALHGGGMDIPANATTCLLDTYATKQWLDYRTKMARVTAFFFNRNGNGRIGILQDSFTFSLGGMITTERVVGSVSIEGSESIVLGVNVCLILLVLGQIGLDVWLVWKRKIRIVSVKFLFFAAADVMIFSVCIIAFLWYADLNAYEPPQINSGLLGKPAAFFNAALGMRALSDEHQTFVTNAGFTIILVLMRILFQLHFHASLAIVTGTLGMASTALAHFAAVFVLCWVCFAVCGMLLLGPTQAAYRDMASALNELLFVAVQDWSVSRSIIFPGLGSQVELVYQALFLWAWIILALVCLFNIVVAILVNGFQRLQEGDDTNVDSHPPFLSVPRSFALFVVMAASSIRAHACAPREQADQQSRLARLRAYRTHLQRTRARFVDAFALRRAVGSGVIIGSAYERMLVEIRRRTKKAQFVEVSMRLHAVGEPTSAEVQGELLDMLMRMTRVAHGAPRIVPAPSTLSAAVVGSE